MPAKKHKPEEIIGKLREVEIMLGQGGTTAEAWLDARSRPKGGFAATIVMPLARARTQARRSERAARASLDADDD